MGLSLTISPRRKSRQLVLPPHCTDLWLVIIPKSYLSSYFLDCESESLIILDISLCLCIFGFCSFVCYMQWRTFAAFLVRWVSFVLGLGGLLRWKVRSFFILALNFSVRDEMD